MTVTLLTADEIFGRQQEPNSPEAIGPAETPFADSGDEGSPFPEPQRQKSLDVGPFARFPNKFFGSGMARKLGPSASVLYIALCEHANREPSNTFGARDGDLAWETGLSPRTIRNVRIKLSENRLVECRREPGQKYTYTLLRPELRWFKLAERPPRQKLKPRGMAAARAKLEP
ncbi:MAG TPA: hypothetical protein VMV98_03735 [Acidobacteriaceae bacterium]|nr:hypothetical protein [Acidobacteriaceae bacterium]